MMSQGNNVDNLKAIFRDTQANSEAVINGAALEKYDPIAENASVLVAVRVTVTDIDGVNKPSKPYRLRVIVHEDDNGHHDRLRPQVPRRGQLMSRWTTRLVALVGVLAALGAIALAGRRRLAVLAARRERGGEADVGYVARLGHRADSADLRLRLPDRRAQPRRRRPTAHPGLPA